MLRKYISEQSLFGLSSNFNLILNHFFSLFFNFLIFIFLVLSVGDIGDGHRGWDRHRLDYQEQDCHHAVCGCIGFPAGGAPNNTGKKKKTVEMQIIFFHEVDLSAFYFVFSLLTGRNLLAAADGQLCSQFLSGHHLLHHVYLHHVCLW